MHTDSSADHCSIYSRTATLQWSLDPSRARNRTQDSCRSFIKWRTISVLKHYWRNQEKSCRGLFQDMISLFPQSTFTATSNLYS